MDLNLFLIQLVGLFCGLFLLRSRHLPKGWVIVSGFILIVLGVTYYFIPAWAGIISGSLWAVLVFLPLVGWVQVNRWVAKEQYGRARHLALWLRWLHPVDGTMEYPMMLRGLQLGQQGNLDQAESILKRYQTPTTARGRLVTAMVYRMGGRWQDLLTWIRAYSLEDVALNDSGLGGYYLRALGEVGKLNELLHQLQSFDHYLVKRGDLQTRQLIRMFVFAFCGRVEMVWWLFQEPLANYSSQMRQFWLATAELAAGNTIAAQTQLSALRDRSDMIHRQAIDRRLTHPPVLASQVLSADSKQILTHLQNTVRHEACYDLRVGFSQGNAPATSILIGLNGLVFLLEMVLGGSTNWLALYYLGALVPEAVVAGEWWRVISATFLHYGALHLLMNMVGLYLFGKFVESAVGIRRFLLIYCLSGFGSMLIITTVAIATGTQQIVVGASGAVMGLLGAIAAILLRGWRQGRSRVARKWLRFVVIMIVFQVGFDLLTPQVSILGHASGLVLGFLTGSLLSTRASTVPPD